MVEKQTLVCLYNAVLLSRNIEHGPRAVAWMDLKTVMQRGGIGMGEHVLCDSIYIKPQRMQTGLRGREQL